MDKSLISRVRPVHVVVAGLVLFVAVPRTDAFQHQKVALDPKMCDQALERAQLAAFMTPESAMVQVELGKVFESCGSVEQAKNAYRKALTLDPGSKPAQMALSQVLTQQGRTGEAAADAHRLSGAESGPSSVANPSPVEPPSSSSQKQDGGIAVDDSVWLCRSRADCRDGDPAECRSTTWLYCFSFLANGGIWKGESYVEGETGEDCRDWISNARADIQEAGAPEAPMWALWA